MANFYKNPRNHSCRDGGLNLDEFPEPSRALRVAAQSPGPQTGTKVSVEGRVPGPSISVPGTLRFILEAEWGVNSGLSASTPAHPVVVK